MNREETKKAIEVMQAYADGKRIQCINRNDGKDDFTDMADPAWDFYRYDYRIKPEPIEIYANIYEGGAIYYLYNTKEGAERSRGSSQTGRTILMREVVE